MELATKDSRASFKNFGFAFKKQEQWEAVEKFNRIILLSQERTASDDELELNKNRKAINCFTIFYDIST